jgi:hypothetical protein
MIKKFEDFANEINKINESWADTYEPIYNQSYKTNISPKEFKGEYNVNGYDIKIGSGVRIHTYDIDCVFIDEDAENFLHDMCVAWERSDHDKKVILYQFAQKVIKDKKKRNKH